MDPKSIGDTTNLFEYENGVILTGKIHGYINPDKYFPSYIVTLFEHEKISYCRFPSGTTYYFTNRNPFDILTKSEQFIEEKNNEILLPFQIAFAYSRDEILIGDSKEILSDMKKSLFEKKLSLDEKRLINDYLENK